MMSLKNLYLNNMNPALKMESIIWGGKKNMPLSLRRKLGDFKSEDLQEVESPLVNLQNRFAQFSPPEDNEKQKAIHEEMRVEAKSFLSQLSDKYGQ